MGQRGNIAVEADPAETAVLCLAVFPTELGWCGLLGGEAGAVGLVIGHASRDAARRAVRAAWPPAPGVLSHPEADWCPALRRRLEAYAGGETVDFADCDVRLPRLTPFQRRVIAATRRIPFGSTASYADLAARAGAPGAARAVGNVMASNPVPIIIPCHRVVGSGGRLGGYSAPQGIALKRRLLELEANAHTNPKRERGQ